MVNLWLLDENDCGPNKHDSEYKGTGILPTVAAEYNLTPVLIFLLGNCYFKLEINRGLTYLTNSK
jgi:hypothetical protein